MNPSRASLSAGFSLALLVAASPANAQSYGQENQVLTIGAAEFALDGYGTILPDGYLYHDADHLRPLLVPLSLPEGALIEKLCLYAHDDGSGSVSAVLVAVKLVAGGESPFIVPVTVEVSSTSDTGYGFACSAVPLSYTIRGMMDIDGDGALDTVAYYVLAQQNLCGCRLGGVRITWKRQVSPPPETPTFGDVPPTDPAFPFIEALAASGITAGCAGGNYCPDAKLTRRQMAVFLAKALGLHWTP